jgi:hypothetical protein
MEVSMRTAKAVAAAIGSSLTALASANAAVQLALEDGSLGPDEIGSVVTAVVVLVATVWAVWRLPNQPVTLTR